MAGALFIIAGIDIPAQLFQRSKRLNMSQQDLKDEYKETEGSPELKGMLRRRQYELLNEIGRASRRERECQYVYISVVAVSLKKTKCPLISDTTVARISLIYYPLQRPIN